MKLNKKKLFPYPVLNHLRDDYEFSSQFNTEVNATQRGRKVDLSVTFYISDYNIEKLLKNNTFVKAVHIECTKTKFRQIHILPKNESCFLYEIDSKVLNGNVEVLPLILNDTDKYVYSNKSFDNDYSNLNFELNKGNIIGYDDTSYFYVEKDKREYTGVESIILVTKHNDKDNDNMIIDVDSGDKIIIDLPELDYESYHSLVTEDVNAQITHQLIIYPAILKALEAMMIEGNRYEIENKNWFKTIKKQLKEINIDIDELSIFNEDNKYDIAQRLLNNSVRRAFDNLLILQGDC